MKTEKQKASKKIRKGDKVVAIAGNYRGMSGTVLACSGEKILVQGLNVRKRHMKDNRDQKGQILQIERPIHVSNLKVCTDDGKPLKLYIKENDKGQREFHYKQGDKEILHRPIKKSKSS